MARGSELDLGEDGPEVGKPLQGRREGRKDGRGPDGIVIGDEDHGSCGFQEADAELGSFIRYGCTDDLEMRAAKWM